MRPITGVLTVNLPRYDPAGEKQRRANWIWAQSRDIATAVQCWCDQLLPELLCYITYLTMELRLTWNVRLLGNWGDGVVVFGPRSFLQFDYWAFEHEMQDQCGHYGIVCACALTVGDDRLRCNSPNYSATPMQVYYAPSTWDRFLERVMPDAVIWVDYYTNLCDNGASIEMDEIVEYVDEEDEDAADARK